jgi:hypothetical protein
MGRTNGLAGLGNANGAVKGSGQEKTGNGIRADCVPAELKGLANTTIFRSSPTHCGQISQRFSQPSKKRSWLEIVGIRKDNQEIIAPQVRLDVRGNLLPNLL